MNVFPVEMFGGVDGTSPDTNMPPQRLRTGLNVECKPGGGIRRMEGYTAFDSTEVPGEGPVRGVWFYGDVCYAFRNDVGGAGCSMYASTGSGWTQKKTGLAPDGTYEFVNYAFSGTQKMYGASRTHKAFEWDGTTWTDLTTGMTIDEPDHITAHRKHLFLSFDNSVQHSSIGDPTSWTPVTGASEILLTDTVTGFSTLPNGSLGIYTQTSIHTLAGTSSSDWVANNKVEYGNNAGALPGTIQSMGSRVLFCDSRGVTDFGASEVSSDFYDAIISHDMDKVIEGRWTRAVASVIVREKKQFRLFFNDGSGIIFVFGSQGVVMPTRFELPVIVNCACSLENSSGSELILFGATDGKVYQLENGRSFDGADITATAETAFTHCSSPSRVKRWRRVRADVGRDGNDSLTVTPTYALGTYARAPKTVDVELPGGLGILGVAILGEAVLGGTSLDDGRAALKGRSEYIALRFQSTSNNELPWELNGYTVEFLPGRQRK
jgi:hypothetical protein